MQQLKKHAWTLVGALLVALGMWSASGACNPNGLDTAFNLAPYVVGFGLLFWRGWHHARTIASKIVTIFLLLLLAAATLFAIFWFNFGNCFTF